MDIAQAIRLANEHERDGTASNAEVTLALWASNARGEIEVLRAECDRLRSRVAVLEARPENAIVAGLEYKAAQLRAERDRLSEQVRDLEESWTAFAVMTHGHCPGPIYYRKFDGGLSRPYGWTHSHWAEKVGYHATPREAVMAAWRYGWEEENRAAILAEPHVDQCYSGRKADGK